MMPGKNARAILRMPKYLGAKIEFNNQQSVIDCIVRNQSRDGALLKVETAARLPRAFDLRISKTRETYRCVTVWDGPKAVGVRFEASAATPAGRRRRLHS